MSKVDTELNNDFLELRMRNNRRADQLSASFRRSIVGRLYEKMTTGEVSTNEEIQIDQDIASIYNIRKKIGKLDKSPYIYDSVVAKGAKNLRVGALLYQYYSGNSHDDAQSRLLFDVPKWVLGYQFAGAVGVGLAMLVSLNRAKASEANYYQLRKMNTTMTVDYLKMLSDFNHYSTNRSKAWLEGEALRAATATDAHIGRNRIEYHNTITNFHEVFAHARNILNKYEPKFVEEMSKYRAKDRRLTADFAFLMGFKNG